MARARFFVFFIVGLLTAAAAQAQSGPGLTVDQSGKLTSIVVNGTIDASGNISSTGSLSATGTVQAQPGFGYVPVGTMMVWYNKNPALNPPAGWVKCDGQTLTVSSGAVGTEAANLQSSTTIFVVPGLNNRPPIYLSNNELSVNANGISTKTLSGIDGTPIVANTQQTYYDLVLPRSLLPNELPEIQVRSKIDGTWVPISMAAIPSLSINNLTTVILDAGTPSNDTTAPFRLAKVAPGLLRVYQSRYTYGVAEASWIGYTSWSSIISAADGYDRWRVVVRNSNPSVELPPYDTQTTWIIRVK